MSEPIRFGSTWDLGEFMLSRIAAIRHAGEKGDYERAHGLEDAFYEQVFTLLAEGAIPEEFVAETARMALSTKELDFERLCV